MAESIGRLVTDGVGGAWDKAAHAPVGVPSPQPLRLLRLYLSFQAVDPIHLPGYSGSAWRGLFGHSLRRLVCLTRKPTCDGCLLLRGCVYPALFETPAAALEPAIATGDSDPDTLPHPFVLEPDLDPPATIAPGGHLGLGVTLFGDAHRRLDFVVAAFADAGQRGLGPAQARFRLTAVECEHGAGSGRWLPLWEPARGLVAPPSPAPSLAPAAPAAVSVHLLTLLRIKARGQFLGPRDFNVRDLLRNLHTRLDRLCRLYGEHGAAPGSRFEWTSRADAADALRITDCQLRWQDWQRWSSRQRAHQPMGGMLGQFSLAGPALSAYWPALWLGQWTHIGKGTAFGLGGYRLEALAGDAAAAAG